MLSLLLSLGLLAGGMLGFILGAGPGRFRRDRPRFRPVAAATASASRMELLYPLAAAFFAGFVFSTLVPEALSHSRSSIAALAAGALGMAVLSRKVLKRDPCCEGTHDANQDHKGLGAVSLAAMAVCSVNDGLLLGLLQPSWLSGLNLGMLLHKVTSSFAIAQVLVRGGYRGGSLAAFGAAYALVSPAVLMASGLPGFGSLPGMDLLMAFSGGILAYVTVASLAPHAGGILRRRPKAAIGFAAALLLSLAIGFRHRALHEEGGGHGAHGDQEGHDAHDEAHGDHDEPRSHGTTAPAADPAPASGAAP